MDLDHKAKVIAHTHVLGELSPNDKFFSEQVERMINEVTNWILQNSRDSAMEMWNFDQRLQEYATFWRRVKKGEIRAYGSSVTSTGKGTKNSNNSARRSKNRVDNSGRKPKLSKRLRRSKTNKSR